VTWAFNSGWGKSQKDSPSIIIPRWNQAEKLSRAETQGRRE